MGCDTIRCDAMMFCVRRGRQVHARQAQESRSKTCAPQTFYTKYQTDAKSISTAGKDCMLRVMNKQKVHCSQRSSLTRDTFKHVCWRAFPLSVHNHDHMFNAVLYLCAWAGSCFLRTAAYQIGSPLECSMRRPGWSRLHALVRIES